MLSLGNIGHIARDCRARAPTTSNEGNDYAYSAEMFESDSYYDPHYYPTDDSPWYFDSGASAHIAADAERLDAHPNTSAYHGNVRTGGGESHVVKGTGTSTLRTSSGEIKLDNVRYVPSLKKNLLSVGSITDTRLIVVFSSTACWVLDGDQIVAM